MHPDPKTNPDGAPVPEKIEEMRRLPRRRLLRWALLGLVPAGVGGGWGVSRWLRKRREPEMTEWEFHAREEEFGEEPPDDGPAEPREDNEEWAATLIQEAGLLCQLGHPDGGVKVDLAVRAAPAYAPARLMRACEFMNEGRWDLAREELATPGLRETPEARLLSQLADRVSRGNGWWPAFFESWTALDAPDFRESPLLPPPLGIYVMSFDPSLWDRTPEKHREERRWHMALLYPVLAQEHLTWMVERVRASTSLPLLLALHGQLLPLDEQEPPRPSLLPVVEARLRQLVGDTPPTLQLALLSLLAGRPPSAPLERADLEALEKHVVLPEWKQPSSEQLFLELSALYEGWLRAPRHHAWLLASRAQAAPLGELLRRRALASRERLTEDERHGLGRLLWEVGARLRAQRSHAEFDQGVRLQLLGSKLTGHPPSWEEATARWIRLGYWEQALARAAVFRWPLARLQEDTCAPRAHQELVWMEAFAARSAPP